MGYIKIIGLIAILGILGGGYMYVNNLQKNNARLHEDIATLKGNIEQFKVSMKDMERERQRLLKVNQDIREEVVLLRLTDEQSQKKVSELSHELSSREHQKKLDRVSKSRGASLHLRLVNKGAKCQWDHFADFSGRCVGGKWKENEKTTNEAPQPAPN
jgi:predicted RNase H-like nuclease (RuvC/YqgF family)